MTYPTETTDTGSTQPTAEGDVSNRAPPQRRSRGTIRTALTVIGLVVVLGGALTGAFFGGYAVKDDAKDERDELRDRVEGLTDDLGSARSTIEQCQAVARGGQDFFARAEELRAVSEEFFFVLDDWALAEVGSAEEAELESRLDSLDADMVEREIEMERQLGRLAEQATACLE
jgi:hypothetical protein